MINRAISHILNEIGAMPPAAQVDNLRAAATPPIQGLLKLACDPAVKFLLPDGPTPFTPLTNKTNEEPGLLYSELRRMYLFVDGGHPSLTKFRRETLWLELLTHVHPDDAALLDLVKDKKLPGKLTAAIVKKAFPTLF